MKKIVTLISCTLLLSFAHKTFAQNPNQSQGLTGQTKNYISTGMPILLCAPDAVASALGDAGVASTPDIYSGHWNNAKFAFIEGDMGFSTTYTPWLRNLGVGDMNLLYLGGYKSINSRSTVAASLTYFSLGEIQSTNSDGSDNGTMNPNEFCFDVTYAMKLNEELSLGATGRFVNSDLTNGQGVSTEAGSYIATKPARSLSADLGVYWQHPIDNSQEFAMGAFVSNLGAKLSYSNDDTKKEFMPANLRVGARYTNEIDNSNKISLMVDFNKLLVPTPPKTVGDSTYSNYYYDLNEWYATGVMRGAIQSFYDAPGGFGEEMREIQVSAGAEYWYKNTLAVRAGYFFEHETKGGRQYATFGFALKYNVVQFDLSYLVPTTAFSSNPLKNTVRISLTFNMDKKKKSIL